MYAFNLQIEPFEFEAELEGEVNRSSRDYIKWVQRSLNRSWDCSWRWKAMMALCPAAPFASFSGGMTLQ